ncbi:hypothetical protein L195_g053826, partial [Trifolium pratense]
MDRNPKYNETSKGVAFKRKANRIPLSPLTEDSILTPNIVQDLSINIPSKRVRIPNSKYFEPVACLTNSLNDSSSHLFKTRKQGQYESGSNSAHSEVIHPTLESRTKLCSKRFPLHNKYIGVRRLDFDDETNGSDNVVNDLDVFKSTMYASSEIE